VRAPVKLYLASSNPGKLAEFRALADWARRTSTPGASVSPTDPTSPEIEFALVPGFASMPEFEETAPTFAENALGKALHYSQLWSEAGGGQNPNEFVFADDSGLVVPALAGAPGVKSARYAGPHATSAERNAKLLTELRGKTGRDREAHFVCVIALVSRGTTVAVVSARADGTILESPTGTAGFGYDPVFFSSAVKKSFAQLSPAEKNEHSHRGKSFRRLLTLIPQLA
jgi:XTP/dITP diphosphohydrolase